MHISVNLDKLRQHQKYLQQQITLANTIITRLETLLQQNSEVSGVTDELYLSQIRFAKDLVVRLRKRSQLLTETTEILLQANTHLSQNTSNALYQLGYDS